MHRLSCLFLLALIGTTAHADKLTLSDVGGSDGDCFTTARATYCGDSGDLPPPGAAPRPLDPTKPVSPTNPICGVTGDGKGIVCSGGPEGPNDGGKERIPKAYNWFVSTITRETAEKACQDYAATQKNSQDQPAEVTSMTYFQNGTQVDLNCQYQIPGVGSGGVFVKKTYLNCPTGYTAVVDSCEKTGVPGTPPGFRREKVPPVPNPAGGLDFPPEKLVPDNSTLPNPSTTPITPSNPGPTPGVAPYAQDGSSTNPNGVCPAGKTWDAPSHKCLAPDEPAPPPVQSGNVGGQTIVCTTGYVWTGTSCVAPTGTGEEVPGEDECIQNPTRIGCQTTEQEPFNDGLLESNINIGTLQPQSVLGSGSCPGQLALSFLGASVPISYQPACTFAEQIKPIVLGVAWVLAGFILIGSSKKE